MRAAILLAGILSFGVMSNAHSQAIYKWVDAEEVTHFSARPPRGVHAERTSVMIRQTHRQALQARTSTGAERKAAFATRKQLDQKQAAENQTQADKDRQTRVENCEKARSRLLTYNSARRLYRPLANGEREYLTNEELDSERAAAQKLVNEWCN